MQRDNPGSSEDALWQSIVDNYGERVQLDPLEDLTTVAADAEEHTAEIDDSDAPYVFDDDLDDERYDEDRFVPAPPPPVPIPPADRLIAWFGVFGSPAILLVCLVFSISLPTEISWLLVAWFVGGFCYLVMKTPGSPRDPWDDGARV